MNARRTDVAALAGVVAFAGIEHGVGEILQGNVAPPALVFPSWRGFAFFDVLAGEPAMSVVPNLLASGILTIAAALAFLAVATVFVDRKRAALLLTGLSVVLLLVGGGFGPPLLGLMVAAAAAKVTAPLTWWRRHLAPGPRRVLAGLWPWMLAACVLAWLTLFPGMPVAAALTTFDAAPVIPIVFLCALALLASSVFTGFAYDIERR